MVKEVIPQLTDKMESSQTPTKESPRTPTKDSSQIPTTNAIDNESLHNLNKHLLDPAVQMTSPLVQSIRGNETVKVVVQENKEQKNTDQNINDKTHDTIESGKGFDLERSDEDLITDPVPVEKKDFDTNTDNTTTTTKTLLETPEHENTPIEISETASISSWLSIDDDIKVKRIKGEQIIKGGTEKTRPVSGESLQ